MVILYFDVSIFFQAILKQPWDQSDPKLIINNI